MSGTRIECPSCGGSGGGPLGRAGGAWDTEDYVCPRCLGTGFVSAPSVARAEPPRPGIAKPAVRDAAEKKKSSSG